MPRRIDIELTSSRDDGTWTWRAAGAKAPKGTVAGAVLPSGAKVGDVLKVDAEFFVDGIEITGVVPTKGARKEPERLELIAPVGKDEPLVTTTLASRGRDDRGPRREGPRRDGPRRDGDRGGPRRGGPARDGERRDAGREGGGRPGGSREGASREGASREGGGRDAERGPRREGASRPPRRTRPEPPPMPAVERPKAKRLRAGKVHRGALLESLPEEQRPIAEQVVLGGLPAVRQAIEKQNAERTAAGEAAIAAGPLLEIAERLVPKVRAAEWRDRAEAAQKDLDHLDLRDLRSVVSAAESGPKDEEARALARTLKEGLAARVDAEHAGWLAELNATLDVGRIVRALRLSSRPPKAGAPLPADVATRLTEGAGAALTSDAAPERWVAVLDALAFAPVRDKVIPASLPTQLHADVQATIARLATRIPKIAHIFEITPDRSAPRPKVERRRPPKPKKPQDKPAAKPKPGADAAAPTAAEAVAADATTAEAPAPDTAAADASVPEAPAVEAPTAEAAAPDTAAADASVPEAPTAEAPTAEAPAPDTLATNVPAVENQAETDASAVDETTAAETTAPETPASEASPPDTAAEAPTAEAPATAASPADAVATAETAAPDESATAEAPGSEDDEPEVT